MIFPATVAREKKRAYERDYSKRLDRQEKNKQYQEKHKLTLKHRATTLKHKAKGRAEKKKIEFSLSFDFIYNKLKNGICEATGFPLDLTHGNRSPYTPSLDRVDVAKGYTEENTQLVCCAYNFMKSDFSETQVQEFIQKLGGISCQ